MLDNILRQTAGIHERVPGNQAVVADADFRVANDARTVDEGKFADADPPAGANVKHHTKVN
jgi:hypothetical protein